MTPTTLVDICKKTVVAWVDDFAPSMGAAISYYTAFSIAPLLVIVIAIAGFVFGEEAVRGALQGQISGLVGQDGAIAIEGLISSAREPAEGIVASGISIALLLVGATTVFAEIQSALDRIWHVPERAKPSGLWGLLRARFLSFGLILGLAFLLIASLAVSAAVAAVGTWFSSAMPGGELFVMALNLALSVAIETVLFAMIYKLMPSTKIAWSDVWVGAFVTSLLFELGKVLIGFYVGKAGISSTYAAAGSLAVILIWVYYAAQIFLLGAEFTKVYATEYGSHQVQQATQSAVADKHFAVQVQTTSASGLRQLPENHPGAQQVDSTVQEDGRASIASELAALVVMGTLFVAREWLERWLLEQTSSPDRSKPPVKHR